MLRVGRQGGDDVKTANQGVGCLALFGAPFLLGGLASLWMGFREWGSPNPQENWWVALIVGVLFTVVGGGIMTGAMFGRGKLLEQAELKRRHPDQPWMWRVDWAKGRVESDSRTTMYFAWGFAGLWNIISWTTVVAALDQIDELMDPRLLLVALFPAVGIGLLAWAITATLRYRKFGVSQLELSTLPGVIGGKLAGRIDTRLSEPPKDGVLLNLDCIRKVRSGKNTRESLLWKTDANVPASRLSRGWQGVSIPVDFAIPADAQESTHDAYNVFWRLSADADLAGVDFKARFEVPVFRTAESASAADQEQQEAETWTFASDREPELDRRDATFVERPSPLGGVEYYFPPRSQKRGIVGASIFLAIWLAVLAAMVYFGVSVFFQVIWGLFALLILLAVLDAAFGSTTIRIEDGRISAANGTLGSGRMRSIGFGEISRIKTDVGSTQSESMTQSSKAWWNIKAVRKGGGRDFLIAQNLRNQREAEWLAGEIGRRLEKG